MSAIRSLVHATAGAVLIAALGAVAPAATAVAVTPGAVAPGGSYRPVTPHRIVDTRSGLGAPKGAARSVTVAAGGHAGIPSSGVAAVVANITVVDPAGSGYVTAYAAGSKRPGTSNLNFARGQTVAAMAIVAVDGLGRFELYSSASTQFLVDVDGYFTTPAAATASGLFDAVPTTRLLDTRVAPGKPIGAGDTLTLQVTGRDGVPAAGVSAVVINTTVTGALQGGYLTDYAAGTARPGVSTINFGRHENLANRAIVAVGAGGRISFYNGAGSTNLVIDISGYFTAGNAGATGAYYVPVAPTRWMTASQSTDSWAYANGLAGPQISVCDGSPNGAPPLASLEKPVAALVQLTVAPWPVSGWMSLYADSPAPPPRTSDVDFAQYQTVSNAVVVPLTEWGRIDVANPIFGRVIMDVSGYFVMAAPVPSHGLWGWGDNGGDGLSLWALNNFGYGEFTVPVNPFGTTESQVSSIAISNLPPTGDIYLLHDNGLLEAAGADFGDSSGVVPRLVTPRPLLSDATAVAVQVVSPAYTGTWSAYALGSDGSVWAWGLTTALGTAGGSSDTYTVTPTQIPGLSNAIGVASDGAGGYAILSDHTVQAWGDNSLGQLGTAGPTSSPTPVAVPGLDDVTAISASTGATFALREDGTVWAWGLWTGSDTPHPLAGLAGVTQLAISCERTPLFALLADGSVAQWTRTRQGVESVSPVAGLNDISEIAPGTGSSVLALDTSGDVWLQDSSGGYSADGYLSGVTEIAGDGETFLSYSP